MLLSKATYCKYICQKKEKQYITVGAVHRTKCQALTSGTGYAESR